MSKLYICVRDDFPDYMTPTLVAHAVLRHHLHWHEFVMHEDIQYENWREEFFKAVLLFGNKSTG